MVQKDLDNFFSNYLNKESIFIDKKVFQGSYLPNIISHRDSEINNMANILAPILKYEKPSNLFVYGKTGTGKTLSIKYVINNLQATARDKNLSVKIIYINCKLKRIADTEYRLVAQLSRNFGKEIPPTGLPTDEVYKIFFNAVEKHKFPILIILDEIDQLIKKAGDGVLYNLTRCNDELDNNQITLVGLSNDMVFIDSLDPRVRSSLSEEEIIFPPYNAIQIKDILNDRAKKAFKQNVIIQGAIEKCAAYSAREHGDARRAIELLRIAAELAERNNEEQISSGHIDRAEEKIERDRLIDIAATQPRQSQSILYSILCLSDKENVIFTGEIYNFYRAICSKLSLRCLTQRRISDCLSELDMLGVINAKIISKGRYGRTREVSLSIPPPSINNIKKILEEHLGIK